MNKGLKYEKSKIFYIKSMFCEKVFIGSTTCTCLQYVLSRYMYRYKKWKNGEIDVEPLFYLLDFGCCKIGLIKQIICKDKNQLNEELNEYKEIHKEKLFNHKIHKPNKIEFIGFTPKIEKKEVPLPKKKTTYFIMRRKNTSNKIKKEKNIEIDFDN